MTQTINKQDLIAVRDAVEDDRAFILATFLRGLYYGECWYGDIKKSVFMGAYHKIATDLLNTDETVTKIACLKEDPSVILGYAIYSHKILHYAFCKKDWRGIGIAKQLIPQTIDTITHVTKVGASIAKKKSWDYNPFLIIS